MLAGSRGCLKDRAQGSRPADGDSTSTLRDDSQCLRGKLQVFEYLALRFQILCDRSCIFQEVVRRKQDHEGQPHLCRLKSPSPNRR